MAKADKGKKKKDDGGVGASLADIRKDQVRGVNGLLDEGLAEAFAGLSEQGIQCLSSEESLGRTVCLPMPALAPRFLFQTEGLVLGRMYLVAGAQESCKSAFLAETGTWHANAGGFYQVIETEQKDAAGLRDSFFNYARGKWGSVRAATQDEWNMQFFRLSEGFRKMMDGGLTKKDAAGKTIKLKPTGRIAPIQFGVDSISAVTIAKFSEKTQEEGAPSMNHPMHAKMLSDFLKEAPKLLSDFPITMFLVSHEKFSSNPAAPHIQVRNTSGGMAPKYQVTTDIGMKRLTKHQHRRQHPKYGEIHSIPIGMNIHKNSMGAHQNIEVAMTWYFDPDDVDPVHGQKRQKTYFDWNTASIELLMESQVTGDDGKGFGAKKTKALRELVDLYKADDGMVSSDALGIGDPVPYAEAGAILEEKIRADATFCTDLYELMGIRRQFMFKSGIDLRVQMETNTELIRVSERKRDLTPQGALEGPSGPDAPGAGVLVEPGPEA